MNHRKYEQQRRVRRRRDQARRAIRVAFTKALRPFVGKPNTVEISVQVVRAADLSAAAFLNLAETADSACEALDAFGRAAQ